MRVYHGSGVEIKVIDLSKAKIGKDFGQGFYVTNILQQAEYMAERVARWNHTQPVVTAFELRGIYHIDDRIVQQLMIDYSMGYKHARNLYFKSQTYTRITSQEWIEVYKALIKELKLVKVSMPE
jgi:hypothetical protein